MLRDCQGSGKHVGYKLARIDFHDLLKRSYRHTRVFRASGPCRAKDCIGDSLCIAVACGQFELKPGGEIGQVLAAPPLCRCPLDLMSVNFCDNKLVHVVFEQYFAHVVKFEWVKHRFDFFSQLFFRSVVNYVGRYKPCFDGALTMPGAKWP
jgi:hypothetical protein